MAYGNFYDSNGIITNDDLVKNILQGLKEDPQTGNLINDPDGKLSLSAIQAENMTSLMMIQHNTIWQEIKPC